MNQKHHEIIVVGGGPGGSTMASLLARQGVDVAVFEREVFPRFHIGESLITYSQDVLSEIGVWDKLMSGKYIKKYGAHFYDYRGQSEAYFEFADGLTTDHPMAFEVPRADFDKDLLDHAVECGAKLYSPEEVTAVTYAADHVEVTTDKGAYTCRFLVDATGRDTLVGKQRQMKHANHDLNNVAVFAHYEGIERDPGKREGNIVVGILPDHAWSWFIPFIGPKTSVGVVCNARNFRRHRHDLDGYLEEMIAPCPMLTQRMRNARRLTAPGIISNYSFGCEHFAGDRWLLIGDAGAFLDPVFSSGVHVAITSAKFASDHIFRALATPGLLLSDPSIKDTYEHDVRRGMSRFKWIINLFYSVNFATDMQKVMSRNHTRRAFTSALAGDVWNDDNPVFKVNGI